MFRSPESPGITQLFTASLLSCVQKGQNRVEWPWKWNIFSEATPSKLTWKIELHSSKVQETNVPSFYQTGEFSLIEVHKFIELWCLKFITLSNQLKASRNRFSIDDRTNTVMQWALITKMWIKLFSKLVSQLSRDDNSIKKGKHE